MHLPNQLTVVLAALSSLLGRAAADHSDNKSPELPTCDTTTTELAAKFHPDEKSERVKITYGPFTAPSNSSHHGMADFLCAPTLPCHDCTITFMQAGLEYADGEPATVETGMSFHHVVFQNLNREDPMCKDSRRGERFFASGDERTPIDLTISGSQKFGYPLNADDAIAFGLEVMNLQSSSRDVSLTVTWEFVPSPNIKNFHPVTPYWFDIGGCGSSGMPAKEKAIFAYSSPTVKAPTSGFIALAGSHLHSGGTQVELLKNGKSFCVGEAVYTNDHITEMSTCSGLTYAQGDEFEIKAKYDTRKYPAMKHGDGELEPVMGIALVYAVKNYRLHEGGTGVAKIVIIVFVSVALIAGLGYAIWRYQKTPGSRLLPVWLTQRIPGFRSVELRGDGRGSEERLLSADRDT